MAGIIRRALHGWAEAGEKGAFAILQSTLEEARQTRLMEVQQAFQSKESELNRSLTREEGAAQRAVTTSEGAATREHQTGLATMTDTRIKEEGAATRQHQTTENAATRALQKQLAEIQEKGASARHGASMSLQREQLQATLDQVQLLPQADGTFQRVKKDGTVVGTLTDLSGNPVQGPKDVATTTKLLVDGNNQIIKGLMDSAAKSLDDKEKKELLAMASQLRSENQRMLGVTAPSGQAGPQPSAGDIEGLKKRASNPAAVSAFESRFGEGSAARYLNAKPKTATPPGGGQTDPMPEEESGLGIIGGRIKRSLKGWNDAVWGD